MSFKMLAWAQSHKTGSAAGKAVLLAICAIVNDDGEGFPSQKRIADDSELSIRTVKREMDRLEQTGYLTRERRYREGGYRTSDAIVLHMEPKILGATESGDKLAPEILGATVSNLRCHSVIAEPVIEPVSNKNKTREAVSKPETRGTRIPETFEPDGKAFELSETLNLTSQEFQVQLDSFLDYWRAVPGAKGRKLNWQSTFRNWLRNYHNRKQGNRQNARPPKPKQHPADVATAKLRAKLGLGSVDPNAGRDEHDWIEGTN